MHDAALPGGEIVDRGLEDLAAGMESVASLLIAIGAPRLRRAGVVLPDTMWHNPEHRLYALLATSDPDSAHSRYNAWIRRLVRYERARSCAG